MVTATWLLLVQLHAPLNPSSSAQWDMRYSGFKTPEQCELFAKQQWKKYYTYYAETMALWTQTFNTECTASTRRDRYQWVIKCDQYDNCNTIKSKWVRR
jgi:hypothetical protein